MKPKRIWAMMGVVYMVIIFLLTTYWIATTTPVSYTHLRAHET